jgi:hypothetical protein
MMMRISFNNLSKWFASTLTLLSKHKILVFFVTIVFVILYGYNPYIPIILVISLILSLTLSIPLSWIICRQAAFPDARHWFHMRMTQGHVIRTPWYDLYLPQSDHFISFSKSIDIVDIHNDSNNNMNTTMNFQNKNSDKEKQNLQVLIFFPGALVEHMAYVGVASRLADQYGIIVAVINLEPIRLTWGGTSQFRMIWLRRDIERRLDQTKRLKSSTLANNDCNNCSIVWNVGGHSLVRPFCNCYYDVNMHLFLFTYNIIPNSFVWAFPKHGPSLYMFDS